MRAHYLSTVGNKTTAARTTLPTRILAGGLRWAAALGLLGVVTAVAAVRPSENPLLEELRQSLEPRAAVWGEVKVGTRSQTESDGRAGAVGSSLAGALARLRAPQAAPAPAALGPDAQGEGIRRLRAEARAEVQVHLRPGNSTVMQIRGVQFRSGAAAGLLQAADPLERTAREFLRKHAPVFRLVDPDQELQVERRPATDGSGRRLRFTQVYAGLPVWPAGLSAHFDDAGALTVIDGAYAPTPVELDLRPGLGAAEATRRARAALPHGAEALSTEPELIIHAPLQRAARLAWRFELVADVRHAWDVVVDAQDGRILSCLSRVCDGSIRTSAKDLAGVARDLHIWSDGSKFYLADTSKAMFNAGADPIKDPRGVISIFDAGEVAIEKLQTIYLIESATAGQWLPDGVSALFNFGLTYDYFLERFGRNSLDGRGGNIQAVVRVADMDNAFWNGSLNMMFFGSVRPYPMAVDVIGHELAHGITQNAADLIYELQPGALNESFSDIFGEMVEMRATGRTDWQIGSGLGKVFRDLRNPGSIQIGGLGRGYPAKMSEFIDLPNSDDADHGGVHINSSILNHCFYLLAEGLPSAIGTRDAERIFYAALAQHLQKQSQFIDARLGCIAAAESLFGAETIQARKTAEAFDAVEIVATPPTPEPSTLPAVAADDSTLLVTLDPFTGSLALGRREAAFNDPADGVALAEPVKGARPAVSGDGTVALYVSEGHDLCAISTADPNAKECLGIPGTVHSVALSPDGQLAAFVLLDPATGQPDNRITVYEFNTDKAQTFELVGPVLDGSPVDQVLYADSMTFSSDGKQLIYDALSSIRFGGGVPVQRWSLFRINLATKSTTVLVPPLEVGDFGNPSMGRAGNRYLAFDARESATGNDTIVTMDLFTGELAEVGTAGRALGYPCFTGDESAIVHAAVDATAPVTGLSLMKQALAPDRINAVGQPSLWLPDAGIGVIYRRGAFASNNQPPVAQLTAPGTNAVLAALSNITLTAQASDPDGSVARVEFYAGAAKLGEAATAPYTFVWKSVPAGQYRVVARAYDNLGGVGDSEAVSLRVGASDQPIALRGAKSLRGLQLTLEAAPGQYQIQRSSDLKTWVDHQAVTVDASGTITVDQSAVTAPSYFRARR